MSSQLCFVSTPAQFSDIPAQQARRHASNQPAQSEKKSKDEQGEEDSQLQGHEQLLVALRPMPLQPEKRLLKDES